MVSLLSRKLEVYRIVAVILICCAAGLISIAPGLCAPETPVAAPPHSAGEKEKLVREGVAYYEQKEWGKAKQHLEEAKTVFPDNYAVPYYLGLIHLEQGNPTAAIAQWKDYVKLDPQSKNALMIRRNITILLREQAQLFAKEAVSRESIIAGVRGEDNTIAVMAFKNMGSENLGPLGKGMAAMLMADLSQVPGLKVVDRIKLQALLDEMNLGSSGLVDRHTAPEVGRLLQAKHVTSGTLADIEADHLVIASAVVDTDESTSIGAQEANGELKKFYDMEKEIACQILKDLGRDCKKAPPAFNKIHTKSMPALVLYSRGLDHFDKGNFDEAGQMFRKALEEDPKFDLAMAALLATPPTAMATMDKAQMISTASTNAPPSATAGTAVAGAGAGTGTGTATAVSGSLGISPITAVVGGAAIIGGGFALAGGGSRDDEPDTQPANTISLTGDWKGTWEAGGEATFSMTQTDAGVSGTVSLIGDACMTAGTISGNVSGTNANLFIQSGAETVALDATINGSAKTLSGTLDYQASASTACIGRSGNFTVTLITGGTAIDW